MPNPRNDQHLLGKEVIARHYYGGNTQGRLIGIVTEPGYIIERSDGSRVTLGHSALRSVSRADLKAS